MLETARPRLNKALPVLRAALLALAFVALGAFLATVLVSPDPSLAILPVTYVGILAYIFCVLLNPLFGFLLWIATSPFARFTYLNISLGHGIPDLSLDRLVAACAITLLMAQLAIRKRSFPPLTWLDVFIVLFLLGAGLSLPMAIAGPRATIQAFFDSQVVPLLVYFLARNLVYNRQAVKAVEATLLFIGAYLAALVIHEQLTGTILFYPEGRTLVYTAHIRRVVGLLGNPAFFATLLGMILPFNLRAAVEAQGRRRWFFLLLVGAILFALYLCYNRAGWLATILAMLLMALLYPRFRRLFVPLILVAVVMVALRWGEISRSYVVTERIGAQAPVDYRLNAMRIAWRMVSDNLLFGRGYGNFGYLYTHYASDWKQTRVLPAPHNSYVNILVSAGLAGLVPYLLLFAAIYLQGYRLWRRGRLNSAINRSWLTCLLAACLVYNTTIFFVDVVACPYVSVLFFFIVGSALGSQERADRWGDPQEWLR